MPEIALTVNGEAKRVPSGLRVGDLVTRLGYEPAQVAVERNACVVPRRTWGEVELEAGDSIEIVTFVGGG